MTVAMQLLVDEVERVQLYNHNQTEFLRDVKEIVGKHILNWVEIEGDYTNTKKNLALLSIIVESYHFKNTVSCQ